MELTKGAKIWLCTALALCIFTTLINAGSGRWPSVLLAVLSMAGLCMILFAHSKKGFYLMCFCYVLSFFAGTVEGMTGGTSLALAVLMSFIGSVLVPGITWLFIRRQLHTKN